jgi:2-oxoglutarate/2-oxoacid ferredoxin oxidoreductase subunit beta
LGRTITAGGVSRKPKAVAHEHDAPHDRVGAMSFLQKHAAKGQIVTGLLYVDPESEDLHSHLDTVDTPLNQLGEQALCPGSAALDKINASLR